MSALRDSNSLTREQRERGKSVIERAAREAAERSAREQGLPPRITDPTALGRVAAIVKHGEKDEAA